MPKLTRVFEHAPNASPIVVFVHGLGGDAQGTWMHNARDQKALWPVWVAQDARCSAWIAGYGAAISGWTDGAMHLADQGIALMSALHAETSFRGRRLVLVGHSLGGLVIKSGMTQAEALGDPILEGVLASVVGVVFIGTPHQGSSLATIADLLRGVLRVNPQVTNMASDDAWLKVLNGQFRHLQAKRKFQVRVFFETKGVLLGRKILGLAFGPRRIVVDRNSSDPGIPGFVAIGLEGDHIQIAKPGSRDELVHKSLVEFLTSVAASEIVSLPDQAAALDLEGVRLQLRRASAPLLTWPTTLPDGSWLRRPELEQITAEIGSSTSSVHLLLGEPGSGKSSLLARLAQEKQTSGWAVLAIKADRLPPETVDRVTMTRHLNLSEDTAGLLRQLAARESVLVVIDQLDALADLVVQHSGRLRVLLDLVQELADVSGLHIVLSCRTFEQRHDPALRDVIATALSLELPPWSDVLPIIEARGLQAANWNEDIREVLRSPHALDTFLTLLEGASEPEALRSFHGLLEQQWSRHVSSDSTGRRRATILHLARLMADREVLGLPTAIVDDHLAEIRSLAAAGLLRIDQALERVEFRHQTLYEFVRARSFLEESGRLTDAVRLHQSSLRIRPQLWHALGYFRSASPEDYGTEIARLWSPDIRPHLKMLLIEFLGRQTSPIVAEQRLALEALDDPWFRPRFLGAAVGSPGWFSTLAPAHLPALMSTAVDQSQLLVPLLDSALKFDATTVFDLVTRYWLFDSAKDILSWRVLGMGSVAPQTGPWVDSLVLIASRTQLAEWAVGHAAGVVSTVLPNEAPRILAAWLNRELESIRSEQHTMSPSEALDDDATREKIVSLLEARQFHDMPAIAEAGPRAFVLNVWPVLLTALSNCAANEHDIVVQYREGRGLMLESLDDDAGGAERPLLNAIDLAICAWAKTDAPGYLRFVNDQEASDLLIVHRFLSRGLEHVAESSPSEVVRYLVADPRRLALGPYSDAHKESIELIKALGSVVNPIEFDHIEKMVVEWKHYKPHTEDDAAVRQRRLQSARQHRLRLLRALPIERRSSGVRRLIDEEERAFPGLSGKDIWFSGVHSIGSPLSAEQMAKSTDLNILHLFSQLTDESAWDHPRDHMKGGAIQAGRELANLAKLDLEKTLRILRALSPGRNEIPVASALRELVSAGLAAGDFFSLLEELEDKGFNSAGFRRDAAFAVANTLSMDCPLPDSLLCRMESWLAPSLQKLESGREAKADEERSSVLWGNGHFSRVPEGNYPTLAALTTAYHVSRPQQLARWLATLEEHCTRDESVDVWRALLGRELLNLGLAERPRSESFVDKLLASEPALLGTKEWIHFLAHTNHWATADAVRRWVLVTADSRRNDQGAGELIGLRLALFPAERWPKEKALEYIGNEALGASTQILGLAHASANLWHEPMTRPVVHPILLQLLRSQDKKILTALSAVFFKDGFIADDETRELLDALVDFPAALSLGSAQHLPEALFALTTAEPLRVCNVANKLLDVAGEQMGNIATSWYLSTEWLLAIALRLQDIGPTERVKGSALFERMLEFNMPQAREMTLDLDKRTPATSSPRPQMRRRSHSGRRRIARASARL